MLRKASIVLVLLVVGSSITAPEQQRSKETVSTDRLVAHARTLIAHESGEPVPYLLQALQTRSAGGDLEGVDEVLRLLADHARDAGDACQWGERIVQLDLQRGVPDIVLARDLLDLARQYRYAGRRPDAAECLDKAERIARSRGDLGLSAGILVQRANIAGDEGRFMDAGILLEAALELFEQAGTPTREHAEVLAELGQLQADSGQLLEAWQSFSRAEQISSQCLPACKQFWQWKKVNDAALLASVGRAQILAAFGRFEDAFQEAKYARVLALRSSLGDRRYMISAEMAEWAARIGRPDLAERWYELALRVGDPHAKNRVRLAYAGYLIETGRESEARLLLGEIPSDTTPKQRVESLLLMGRADLLRGESRAAADRFRNAARLARPLAPVPALLWQAHSGLGEALLSDGRTNEGILELQAAVQVVRDWAGGVLDPALAYQDGPKSPWHAYGLLIATHVRQNRTLQALGLSEEMKAIATIADRAEEGVQEPVAEHLSGRVSDIRIAIASARRALHENTLRDPIARSRATAELQVLDNELLRLTAQHNRPRPSSDRSDALVSAARKIAQDRACAFVSFSLSANHGIAFVITGHGLETKQLNLSQDQLRSLVGLMRIYRESPDHAWKSDPAPRLLRDLRTALIGPIEPELRGVKRLVIIPDGVLWTLPFEMLWQRDGNRVQYLIEEYAISYAPSVRAAVEWASRARMAHRAAPRDVRVVANGVASNESSRELSPRRVCVAANDAEIVRRALGSRVSVFEGSAATKSALMKALGEADVLHVAAHATYAKDYPPASYISLAQELGASSSGLLRGWEISEARCRAGLVFLAACDTGRTSSLRGRGVLGLTGAVMAAGANACIGSRWADRDAATESYIAQFYQRYAKSRDASDAAQKAACNLIAAGAPPYDWAAFMVLGW